MAKARDPDKVQAQARINLALERARVTPLERPPLTGAVLMEINIIREELGLPTVAQLQPGFQNSAFADAVANTLCGRLPNGDTIRASVGSEQITFIKCLFTKNEEIFLTLPIPRHIRQFVASFDRPDRILFPALTLHG